MRKLEASVAWSDAVDLCRRGAWTGGRQDGLEALATASKQFRQRYRGAAAKGVIPAFREGKLAVRVN